jgi:tRNA pseudouridine38-40 synthase
MNPLLRRSCWHVPRRLDIAAMRRAASHFIGKHDFRAFAANPGYAKQTYVRDLWRCEVKKSGPFLTFIVEGDGFLYKMCRGIVGTLVQVVEGKYSATEMDQLLAGKDRRLSGMSAPAHGLVLWKVFYKKPRHANRPA